MRRSGVTAAAVIVAAVVLAVSDVASGFSRKAQDPGPLFKSAVDLVVLHVNVFDRRSDAVEQLPQSAFIVLEDDKPQEITFFNSEDVPVAVGLVIDNSSSMLTRRAMVLSGAKAFAESSHPEDELFTVVFNEDVKMGLPDGVAYTHSRDQVLAALNRFPAGGRTAMFDAVIAGLDHLQQSSLQKKVLIVLSDGDDNASQATREQMLGRASESDALIYTVARRGGDSGNGGDPGVMRRLAEVSGGVAYFPRSEQEVVESFTEIATNIRRGYSIGYVPPTAGDGRYHKVRVLVRMPGRTLSTRARDGYLAPHSTSAQ